MLLAGIADRPVDRWRNIAGGAGVSNGLIVSLLLVTLPVVWEASIRRSSVESVTPNRSVRNRTGPRGSWPFR